MNMFGKLAEFIWDYQEEIEIAFIIVVAAAAAFFIGRMVRANRKKRELLSQISDTVSQINTTVSSINDKRSGVVYIDNRVSADARPKAVEAAVSEALSNRQTDTGSAGADGSKGCPSEAADHAEAAAVDTVTAEGLQPEAAEQTEETAAQAVRKYFSRDCAVSKKGKSYTLEELNDQIRE